MKLLFLSDTHLGFDYTENPRIDRRRRSDDFFANYRQALAMALKGEADLVVHAGDLFHRSRVPQSLISQAFAPLLEIAEQGIPVYMIPGNHERGFLPRSLFETHPNIHTFSYPRTFIFENSCRIALAGFPSQRKNIRSIFTSRVNSTGWQSVKADLTFLVLHQIIQGAAVGIQNYVFQNGPDIIRAQDIPPVTAVLCGHIHTQQVLHHAPSDARLAAPVIFSGSTERTSFVERLETKGMYLFEFNDRSSFYQSIQTSFIPLSSRPMIDLSIDENISPTDCLELLQWHASRLPANSIVRIRLEASQAHTLGPLLRIKTLRNIFPKSMNIQISIPRQNPSPGNHHSPDH